MNFKSCLVAFIGRSSRFVGVAFGLVAILAGCGQTPYPPGWSPVKTTWFGCPDLAGTYFLGIHGDDASTRVLARASVFNSLIGNRGVTDKDVLVIEQDANKNLRFRLGSTQRGSAVQFDPRDRWSLRAREMTEAQFADALHEAGRDAREVASIVRSQRHCSFGWLELPGNAGEPVRLAMDDEGFLIAQATHEDPVQIDVWCGDGCKGIPFGHVRKRDWARLVAFSPSAVAVSPVSRGERRPGGRFGAGAEGIGEPGQPLDAAAAAYIFESMGGIEGPVRATPGAAGRSSAEVTLSAPSRDDLAEALRKFNELGQFSGFSVSAYSGMDSHPQIIRVRIDYEPFRTDAAIEPMRQELMARLPSGATLLGLQGRRNQITAIIRLRVDAATAFLEQRSAATPYPWRSMTIVGKADASGAAIVRVTLANSTVRASTLR